MPVYIKENASYLRKALDSVTTAQEWKPNEVIIVEDGPITPEIDHVLAEAEKRHPGIIRRLKLERNEGMGRAMNFGLHNASSTWIARMDSDDVARPNRFKAQFGYLEQHPDVDVIGSSIEEFDQKEGDLQITRTMPETHEQVMSMMKWRTPINHMTVVYRRDLAIKAGGYWSERNFEDYNLWYEMSKLGARFHNLSDNLVDARIGNNMIQRRRGLKYFRDEERLLKKFRSERFISRTQYMMLWIIKFTLRMLPAGILKIFYRYFLRSSI